MGAAWVLVALLLAAGPLSAREKRSRPPFKYAAGTENLQEGCEGNLELGPEQMSFRCQRGAVTVPYASIIRMEYRTDISSTVSKLRVNWKVSPTYWKPFFGGKQRRFFALVYRVDETTHVLVLRVRPERMRPYLAEIDLKAEKHVEVENLEEY